MVIRCPRGLGDAVYCWPIVRHFARDFDVTVITNYPIIFDNLKVENSNDFNLKADLVLSYNSLRNSRRSQYQDILDNARLSNIPFQFQWDHGFTAVFSPILKRILKALCDGRKRLCVIKEPCAAHLHKKRSDFSITPNRDEMNSFIQTNPDYIFVSVGSEEIFKERLKGVTFDIVDQTSVQDMISLVSICDIVATQIGHLVPIAQGLEKELKIFYPEKIVDKRFMTMGPHKMEL